jgi:hypothetical protein
MGLPSRVSLCCEFNGGGEEYLGELVASEWSCCCCDNSCGGIMICGNSAANLLDIFFGWTMPSNLTSYHTNNANEVNLRTQQHCYVSLKKPYPLAGFEPVSPVPQADAMTTVLKHNFFTFVSYACSGHRQRKYGTR